MNNASKLLYIGLNGLAGSGKDTVAKMLKAILVKDWDSLDECKQYYNMYFSAPNVSATFNNNNTEKYRVFCIAFADQLKNICSSIFGIPVDKFYNNKSNAWICINKDFHYTEIRPDNVITCQDYFYNCAEYKNSETHYYLSLRDILVYIGTYVLQQDVNKDVFTNIVQNVITEKSLTNHLLKYVIVTDIRFVHELDYIKSHNGVTIKIVKPDVVALDNIAEHELDDEDSYTFVIDNNGSYDDLFQQVWNMVKLNPVFKNITQQLYTRDNICNFVRKIIETDTQEEWQICSPYGVNRIAHNNGEISMVELVGGPTISLNEEIIGTNLIPSQIVLNDDLNAFSIYVNKPYKSI